MAGGSATTAGTTFQENVAAWFACLILAETKTVPIVDLGPVTLERLIAETIQPIDDLYVGTSDDGHLFIQCKTTLSFSEANQQFVQVIGQFVRQFHFGYVSPSKDHRALDQSRDRLILAVSDRAPATIRTDLRDLLDTIRSCRDSASLTQTREALSDSRKQQLQLLERIVLAQSNELLTSPLTPEQIQELLRFIHVLPLDFSTNGPALREAQSHLINDVLFDPSRSDDAWNLLVNTIRDFSPKRTGGDRRFFRHVLEEHRLIPRPVPSASSDIESLSARSTTFERHVESFSTIPYKDKNIRLSRLVVSQLLEEANSGDVLVVGSAGAGKSGCLYEFVQAARENGSDVVLLAVDQLAANSIVELEQELRLSSNRDLVELFANWTGESSAFLVIDALDAARSTYSLSSLCSLIRQMRRHAPRWRVIASIREFDLRHSREVRQLFAGQTADTYVKQEFVGLRHVCVGELSEGELEDFASQAPEVAQARNGTEQLTELTRNPFNLRLLTELVESSVNVEQLNLIKTQVGLLDLYWEERVDSHPRNGGGVTALTHCVRQMVEQRQLAMYEGEVEQTALPASNWIEPLASAGVLKVSDSTLPGGDRQISFLHNILFDYAVARLLLSDLSSNVIEWLGNAKSQDLVLAIRPSVMMTFQRLWHSQDDRQLFWDRALAVVNCTTIRLIGKIIAADVAAMEFRCVNDFALLIQQLDLPGAQTLLRYSLQAAVAHFQQDPKRYPLWGPGAPEWLSLAAHLAESHTDMTMWSIRSFLAQLPAPDSP